uniref:MADF domain-containing protein n=1 Tax=Timema bartmani TaxID=61472 RepID=A0A7R9FC11_9NEOP|nr:unnamed protein product [Timema bartmani]
MSAYAVVLEEIGLQDSLTLDQAKKKWDNLLRKYKDLKNPKTGRGTEGEETPKSWPFWEAMDLAVGQRDIMNLPELYCSSSGLQPRAESVVDSWEGYEASSSNSSQSPSPQVASYSSTKRGTKRKLNENVFKETCEKIQGTLERQGDKLNQLLEAFLNK